MLFKTVGATVGVGVGVGVGVREGRNGGRIVLSFLPISEIGTSCCVIRVFQAATVCTERQKMCCIVSVLRTYLQHYTVVAPV